MSKPQVNDIEEQVFTNDSIPTTPELTCEIDEHTEKLALELYENRENTDFWNCLLDVCQPQTTFVLPDGSEIHPDEADTDDTA